MEQEEGRSLDRLPWQIWFSGDQEPEWDLTSRPPGGCHLRLLEERVREQWYADCVAEQAFVVMIDGDEKWFWPEHEYLRVSIDIDPSKTRVNIELKLPDGWRIVPPGA
jgi:hypothetical protein